jgi:pteridine reductase
MDSNMLHTTKVALVTGGAKRIGRGISEFLHQQGLFVAIHCHTATDEAQTLVNALNIKRENSCMMVQADLKNLNDYPKIINAVVEKWGRLDILINNASAFYATPFKTAALEDFDDLFTINLKAPFFLIQAASTALQKYSGCVINITDIHAQKPLKFYSLYCMTKASLKMLTETLSRELAPKIRVNAVAPGSILWPQNLNTEQKTRILEKVPLKRQGKPIDIAKTVWFLIESDYITGQTIMVDGGRLLD